MKKKIMFLSFLCLFVATSNVNASSFSSFYPGGKNYLEFENFTTVSDTISSIDNIRVKGDTTYTMSIPGYGSIENAYFFIESINATYIDDYAESFSNCDYTLNHTVCTFTTSATEEYISIELEGMFLGGVFSYYEGEGFQLEEGSIRTEYEEYIDPFMDSNNPEFSGSAAFIMAYHDSYDITEIIAQHLVAIDDIDGDISENIEIISDDYTLNKHIVGEYLVELQVSDQSGNIAYFNLVIIIKDEEVPSILGPTELNINVNDGFTIEDIILSNYSGLDGYDGDVVVTASTDEYSLNKTLLGIYNVTLFTIDSSGNTTTKDISITVIDNEGPVLDSSNMINIFMSNPKELTVILDELPLTDNYNVESEITTTILVDNYTSSSDQVGSYTVTLLLEDKSMNTTSVTLYLNVIDDIAPFISGPSSYSISYINPLTLDQIIELFTVSDNYDNLSTQNMNVVLNTYTTRNTDTGVFIIEFEVSDSSLNTTTHSMEISVIDDQAPIIYIDDYLVALSVNASFTTEDALSILINNHELPNKSYTIAVLNDEYTGNENHPGTYLYSLLFTDTEGTSLQKDFLVKVSVEEQLVDSSLIVRNIIVYGVMISFFCFVVYKNKK